MIYSFLLRSSTADSGARRIAENPALANALPVDAGEVSPLLAIDAPKWKLNLN
jgi:hypothetical protein